MTARGQGAGVSGFEIRVDWAVGRDLIEIFFEFLFELLAEVFVYVAFELLLELGFEGAAESLKPARESNKWLAAFGYLLFGAAVGALSAWALPRRLSSNDLVSGSSLVLNPLLAGTAMYLFGMWRRSHGHRTTRLATFVGGAAFAFGVALVRYLVLVD
ncbi:MAG: hypothetical protein PVI30_04505 [Myxococcales bacterium]